jgi:ankyrin repeat protein
MRKKEETAVRWNGPLRLAQPDEMKTKAYVYGVEKLNGYDAWALFEACALGNISKVKTLLRKDSRLVNAQYWYQFPIHMAVLAGKAAIVKLLLDRGADPGQSRYTYSSWPTLLHGAQERGYREIASLLQQAMRKRFNYSPEFGALQQAIVTRDLPKIKDVLRRKPQLAQASDALGNSPLHWSVLTRQLGLIDRFIELGTPIDSQRADGQTPVMLAVNGTDYWYRATRGRTHPSIRNAWVLVGSLLAHGARYTLSIAAAVGDQEKVQHDLKMDDRAANRLDSARVSPLSYASRSGYTHIVRLLLDHGADPNRPEEAAPEGRALFEACCGNHLEVAQLLLEHGANPNSGTDSNGCCLTICQVCHGGRAKALQQLLRQHGACTPPYAMNAAEMRRAIRGGNGVVYHDEFLSNILAKEDAALLDLYLASDSTVPKRLWPGAYPKSPELMEQLLARGLDPNKRDWMGRTFLHCCAANADQKIAAALLKAGADIDARDFEYKGTPLAAALRSWSGKDNPKQIKRRREMVEFLLEHGAATHLPGDEPWATPLAWARRRRLDNMVELLRQRV